MLYALGHFELGCARSTLRLRLITGGLGMASKLPARPSREESRNEASTQRAVPSSVARIPLTRSHCTAIGAGMCRAGRLLSLHVFSACRIMYLALASDEVLEAVQMYIRLCMQSIEEPAQAIYYGAVPYQAKLKSAGRTLAPCKLHVTSNYTAHVSSLDRADPLEGGREAVHLLTIDQVQRAPEHVYIKHAISECTTQLRGMGLCRHQTL